MKRILHITTHMGGGVGKVLSGIAAYAEQQKSEWKHTILLLEQPEKTNFMEICREKGVEISVAANEQQIRQSIEASDIVQLEWWHHPLMAKFLANFPQIPMRAVVWSHISGNYYPWLPAGFVKFPKRFLFTSPYSFENPYWTETEKLAVKERACIVYSSGGFDNIQVEHKTHKGFNIGYIGTQSYAKLHSEFVSYCQAAAEVPDSRFIMVGDMTNQKAILQEAANKNMAEKFEFVDYVSDVNKEFAKMDVFGYLLNPHHFGTTENVLLEAMAAEVPVVCLEQCTEKYLIQDNVTGLLVRNKKEYGEAVRFLYEHPEERQRLGRNARDMVRDKFSVKNTVENLERIYEDVLAIEKRFYNFSAVFGEKPYQYFLACLPAELKLEFEKLLTDKTATIEPGQLPVILRENSKSSIKHFARTYPEDAVLQKWAAMLERSNFK